MTTGENEAKGGIWPAVASARESYGWITAPEAKTIVLLAIALSVGVEADALTISFCSKPFFVERSNHSNIPWLGNEV